MLFIVSSPSHLLLPFVWFIWNCCAHRHQHTTDKDHIIFCPFCLHTCLNVWGYGFTTVVKMTLDFSTHCTHWATQCFLSPTLFNDFVISPLQFVSSFLQYSVFCAPLLAFFDLYLFGDIFDCCLVVDSTSWGWHAAELKKPSMWLYLKWSNQLAWCLL